MDKITDKTPFSKNSSLALIAATSNPTKPFSPLFCVRDELGLLNLQTVVNIKGTNTKTYESKTNG
jgi:hypothetical protein